jgi:hypothetical protein
MSPAQADAPPAPLIPEFSPSPVPAAEVYEPAHEPMRAQVSPVAQDPSVTPARPMPEARPAPRAPDPAEIQRALQESGLELVQTRPGVPVEAPPEPGFVPAKRERRPAPADLEQPLVQVETGRKNEV